MYGESSGKRTLAAPAPQWFAARGIAGQAPRPFYDAMHRPAGTIVELDPVRRSKDGARYNSSSAPWHRTGRSADAVMSCIGAQELKATGLTAAVRSFDATPAGSSKHRCTPRGGSVTCRVMADAHWPMPVYAVHRHRQSLQRRFGQKEQRT